MSQNDPQEEHVNDTQNAPLEEGKTVAQPQNGFMRYCVIVLCVLVAILIYAVFSSKRTVENIAQESQKILNDVAQAPQNALDELVEQTRDELGKNVGENKLALEANAKENRQALADNLQEVDKRVVEILDRWGISNNCELAQEALELSSQAKKGGEYDLAKVYILNAINHCPSDISYLKAYYDLISENGTLEDYQRFLSLVDVVVYQIDPRDIAVALDMRDAIEQKISTIETQEAEKTSIADKAELRYKLERLKSGDLSWNKIQTQNGHANLNLLSKRMELVQSMLADDVMDENETQRLTAELKKATLVFQLEQVLHGVDVAIAKANDIVATGTIKQAELVVAQNQLQTATSYLAQIWTTDCGQAPEYVERAKKAQKTISAMGDKITELGSRPYFEKIMTFVKELKGTYEGAKLIKEMSPNASYTKLLKDFDAKMEKIAELVASVTNDENMKTIRAKLKAVGQIREEYNAKRFEAYNAWANEQIKTCDDKWQGAHWDGTYEKMFDKYLLKIHPGLLDSETKNHYDLVSERVIEQTDSKRMETRLKKARTKWTTLEEF